MDIRIEVQELTKALARAQSVVEAKTPDLAHSHALLVATKDGLAVSASDGEVSVVGHHPCEVKSEGKALLPARALYDIVKVLPDTQVSMSLKAKGKLHIKSGAFKAQLTSEDPENFHPIPAEESVQFTEMDPGALDEQIGSVQFAMSNDESRFNLTGLYWECLKEKALRISATDGHRLAVSDHALENSLALTKGALISRKGISALRKLLKEGEGPCAVGFTSNTAFFKQNKATLQIRLLVGQFPDYRQVIPKSSSRSAIVNRLELQRAVHRIAIVGDPKSHAFKLSLDEGKVVLDSENHALGEAHEEVKAETTGTPLSIGFNTQYLSDVLGVLGSEKVKIELEDDKSPGVVKSDGDDGYLCILMPMRF